MCAPARVHERVFETEETRFNRFASLSSFSVVSGVENVCRKSLLQYH